MPPTLCGPYKVDFWGVGGVGGLRSIGFTLVEGRLSQGQGPWGSFPPLSLLLRGTSGVGASPDAALEPWGLFWGWVCGVGLCSLLLFVASQSQKDQVEYRRFQLNISGTRYSGV